MSNERRKNWRTNPRNDQGHDSGPPVYLIVEHNSRKVAILRNPNYQDTIVSIKKNIHSLKNVSNHQIVILALFEEINEYVQITEEVWPKLLSKLLTIRVELDEELVALSMPSSDCSGESHQGRTSSRPPDAEHPLPRNNLHGLPVNNLAYHLTRANVFVRTLTGKTINCILDLSNVTVLELKGLIQDREGIPIATQRLLFAGRQLEDGWSLSDYCIMPESTIQIVTSLRGGKPVIYLFPSDPTPSIRVNLSLTQSWAFSSIYPPTSITTLTENLKSLGQTLTWTVDAEPNGTLHDQGTGRTIADLFWEALTNPDLPSSPPVTRPSSLVESPFSAFNPASPTLLPSDSVLLPFDKVTGYIDNVLLALGLHTEARTSFITYWLPDLSKHAFIALRFLPQDEYEEAAPLKISPAPEVITRVFMLFGGIEESRMGLWDEAVVMARRDVAFWRDVVGIDIEKAQDKSLFRVLEWGGMEVK